jgi:hypothetical protein
MGEAELERGITVLRACWEFFDDVAARVSPEMRKGPRGGGRDRDRDRDQIIGHTVRTESEYFAKQVGLRIPERAAMTPDGLRQYRETYVAAMRAWPAVALTTAGMDVEVITRGETFARLMVTGSAEEIRTRSRWPLTGALMIQSCWRSARSCMPTMRSRTRWPLSMV